MDGMTDDEIAKLPPYTDRAWQQGIEEMHGVYRQATTDTVTCQRCGYTYQTRRTVRFVRGGGWDYVPAEEAGCPKVSRHAK